MEWPMDYVCLGMLVAVAIGVVVLVLWLRARKKAYSPEGATADATVDADSRFVLEMPAGPAVDLYVHYSMGASRMSGGGISYGMVMRLDVTREGAHAGSASAFSSSHEYLFGRAQRPFGEVPLGETLDAGTSVRMGTTITRGVRLMCVPAGGRLVARGHIEMTGATENEGFVIFAKPPR